MLLQPFSDASDGSFDCIGRRVRSMKDSHFFKQDNGDAAPLSFRNFGTKLDEQCLDIAPPDISACGASKDQLERSLVPTLHSCIVLRSGTGKKCEIHRRSTRRLLPATSLRLLRRLVKKLFHCAKRLVNIKLTQLNASPCRVSAPTRGRTFLGSTATVIKIAFIFAPCTTCALSQPVGYARRGVQRH
jgi:hypothetical protein